MRGRIFTKLIIITRYMVSVTLVTCDGHGFKRSLLTDNFSGVLTVDGSMSKTICFTYFWSSSVPLMFTEITHNVVISLLVQFWYWAHAWRNKGLQSISCISWDRKTGFSAALKVSPLLQPKPGAVTPASLWVLILHEKFLPSLDTIMYLVGR